MLTIALVALAAAPVSLSGVADSQEATMAPEAAVRVAFERTLSTTGSTRGTAYDMSNKIVSLGPRTHIAWLDAVSKTTVATLDRRTGEWLGPWIVGEGFDNHGGPALTADSSGHLHIVFGPHGGEFQHFRSARPNDASQWTPLGLFGVRGTYPSLVCDSEDTLHCAYRGMDPPLKLAYQRRPRDGEWSAPVALVDATVPDGYTQYGNGLTVGPDDALHLVFHVYDLHPAAAKAVGYLKSVDGGGTWTLADGTPVSLPFSPQTPGWVEQGPDLDMRVGNVQLSPEGQPCFVVGHYEARPSATLLWRWDGSAWRSTDLTPIAQEVLPGCGTAHGTLTFDADGRLWVATQAYVEAADGTRTTWIVLFTSNGADGEPSAAAVSPPSPGGDVRNWYPSLERTTGRHRVGTPHLIYTRGVKGTDNSEPATTEIHFIGFDRQETQEN